MFTNLLLLFADAQPEGNPPATPDPNATGSGWTMWLPIPLLLVLFYFLMIRPNQKMAQERQQFLANLKKNDKVATQSGIIGNVVSVSETENEVVVKIDDNTRVRMTKESILRNLTQEEAAKAAKDQPKEQPK